MDRELLVLEAIQIITKEFRHLLNITEYQANRISRLEDEVAQLRKETGQLKTIFDGRID